MRPQSAVVVPAAGCRTTTRSPPAAAKMRGDPAHLDQRDPGDWTQSTAVPVYILSVPVPVPVVRGSRFDCVKDPLDLRQIHIEAVFAKILKRLK